MTKFWIKIKLPWKFDSIHFANNSILLQVCTTTLVSYYPGGKDSVNIV